LSCFAGGMFAIGAMNNKRGTWTEQLHYGAKLTETCYEWYRTSPSGLGGEAVSVIDEKIEKSDGTYLLRPELVESIFYMWRITHDPKYRDWGWEIVKSLDKNCKKEFGYSGFKKLGISNNKQESFFLAETLKYLYLLFSEDDVIPLEKYVFNTEAHPISIRGFGKRGD
jgi:mannosyl-oligosaccharide alpha-1,2-mannosidase